MRQLITAIQTNVAHANVKLSLPSLQTIPTVVSYINRCTFFYFLAKSPSHNFSSVQALRHLRHRQSQCSPSLSALRGR